jgi:hypothetical protein
MTTMTSAPLIQTMAPTYAAGGLLSSAGVLGPNTYGVPENFPLLPADAGCHKCHGTGYKKKLITRRWAPCKKCAAKYGTDVSAINLYDLPPVRHHLQNEPGVTVLGAGPTSLATNEFIGGLGSVAAPTMIGTTTTG